MVSKDKPATTIKGKPRLQLKGRIYMANVTDIVCLQKPGMSVLPSLGQMPATVLTGSPTPQDLIEFKSFGRAIPVLWTISSSVSRMRT